MKMFWPRFPRRKKAFLIITGSSVFWILMWLKVDNNSRENICMDQIQNQQKENLILPSAHEPEWQRQLIFQSSQAVITGDPNPKKMPKFMVIGISTLYRKENYLQKTLESFVNESTPEEREDVIIVVLLADTDLFKKDKNLQMIRTNFKSQVECGFIQIIECNSDIYPDLESVAANSNKYGETPKRVKWRMKQVIDFAFLISYVSNLSLQYYLVMEDDIITVPGYISAIKDFIRTRSTRTWVALRFSMFVGIGLLLRGQDLSKLVKFLLMFYEDLPVDMLLRKFASLMMPEGGNLMRRIPSIFQHIGLKSTLSKKFQGKIDKSFDAAKRRYKNQNPPADIFTNMKIHEEFYPEYAYKRTPGFFWGILQKPGDTYDIVFSNPIPISRIVVLTGIVTSAKQGFLNGTLNHGYLEAGKEIGKILPSGKAYCETYTRLGTFRLGEIDLNLSGPTNTYQCIRIKVDGRRGSFVVIKEIEIFQ